MKPFCEITLKTDGDATIVYNSNQYIMMPFTAFVQAENKEELLAKVTSLLSKIELELPDNWQNYYGPSEMRRVLPKLKDYAAKGKNFSNSANHLFEVNFSFNRKYSVCITD